MFVLFEKELFLILMTSDISINNYVNLFWVRIGKDREKEQDYVNLTKPFKMAIIGKRGPLVLQTLYAPVQGNARAKKWE